MSDVTVGLTTGGRVAVRSRIDPPPACGPTLTDTVGELLRLDEETLTVRTRHGDVTLRREHVVASRAIPPRPARRGAPHRAIGIEDLHLVMTRGQPGLAEARLGAKGAGWLLRAGAGWTGRSNSALPVGDPGMPLDAAVDAVEAWYDERGLPPLLMLPRPPRARTADDPLGALLLVRGWRELPPADVLTGRTADLVAHVDPPAGVSLTSSGAPTRRGSRAAPPACATTSTRPGRSSPCRRGRSSSPPTTKGGVAGVARVAMNDGWAGVFGVHVSPAHRGRGLGRWLTVEALRAAERAGATLTYLQVEQDNAPAQHLYRSLGLTPHHDYVYLARRG
ncbi:N-acetyltransferase GCN5 [Janibacter hoylei PVAS-1]|uniref:N-acetyltransferase GCN5 n=1 Tax=Janibacter hoylei PVAS-1 TaxID=1210046 RepID=K1E6X9_9MICO|nr:GNAT family N-acetyltransferase [Janibacter hoylei]EKA62811.1 N-acetyltransferase GCN5 [Janibacter hoylei PVAS-1]